MEINSRFPSGVEFDNLQEHFFRVLKEDAAFRTALWGVADLGRFSFSIRSMDRYEKEAFKQKRVQVYNSVKWKEFRFTIFSERGKKCEKCKSEEKLHLHHLNYDNLGNEKREDVQILCNTCHRHAHIL